MPLHTNRLDHTPAAYEAGDQLEATASGRHITLPRHSTSNHLTWDLVHWFSACFDDLNFTAQHEVLLAITKNRLQEYIL